MKTDRTRKKSSIEKKGGIHIKERLQATKGKSTAEQYEEFHNLDYSLCNGSKVEDVSKRGKVKVIEGDSNCF